MQTPYLPRSVFAQDFEKVYEPAEDSFLLLDALERDLDYLKRNAKICLECGSGSGIIATSLAQAFKPETETAHDKVPIRLILTTDLNFDACKTTKKCAKYHEVSCGIEAICTDLAESLVDRLENFVDLMVFNPPYVPTENYESEIHSKQVDSLPPTQLHLSWAGGGNGRRLIDRFLHIYVPKLLSKPNGVAYIVALEENNIKDLQQTLIEKHRIVGSIAMERQAGAEHLYVIKYEWLQ